jgi:cardiolipin synthase
VKGIRVIVVAVATTAIVTLIVVNLIGGEKRIDERPAHLYAVADPQFIRAMGVLLGPPLVGGNDVRTLLNGDQIFPAMLEAIRGARQSIDFETYIYWSGTIGKAFADALSERARAGVQVRVMLDWVGSEKMDGSHLDQMRQAGVEVRKYHPVRWYTLNRLNNRTHRKLLIVDGQIGFTGGVGIADEWTGHAQDPEHWRDTHFQLRGPAVAQMQAAFADNWTKLTGTVLHGDDYFPAPMRAGDQQAQVFKSSIDGGSESMHLMYLLSIAAATKTIDLAMAYFVPDSVTEEALVAALRRGVRMRIILPNAYVDAGIVRRASRAKWGALLDAGAEIYEYQPTMYHCKVLVVDGLWVSVGSTNFDNRSFRLNDEANLNVFDGEFARHQIAIFEDDLKHSRRIQPREWQARPWTEKAQEQLTRLLSDQF